MNRAMDVRRTSVRVALIATGLVAIAYLVVAVGVVALFMQSQLAEIDAQLTGSVHFNRQPEEGEPYEAPAPRSPGGVPILAWRVEPDGSLLADTRNPFASLPPEARAVVRPATFSVDGHDVRLAGFTAPDGDRLILGQSLDPLYGSRATIVGAEIAIAPVLLLTVFLGAVAIGRRVAAPIEQARIRQLELTADASHELRTPLSVIEANTSLALREGRSADWYRTAFERVDRESKRMHRLVDDILWLARFDATQAAPASEPVDLATLARQAVDRFAAVAEARRLRLAVDVPGPSAVVNAPPEWLDRLLGVLVDNACKYSPEGGFVTISIDVHGGRASLAVDDSGPGIPEHERSRVFDRFHRATDTPGGAGLGLAIGDAIVRATHGRWSVGSSPSGGARMAVSWPLAFPGRRTAAGSAREHAGAEAG